MSIRDIAVIGAGNGGQAIAGYLAMNGHHVRIFNRTHGRIEALKHTGGIRLTEAIEGFGGIAVATCDLREAICDAELIMVATTADAHAELASHMAPLLQDGQVIVLNPGRTAGAIEFRHVLRMHGCRARVYLAEAQSLVYACRSEEAGSVRIIGVKKRVLVAALPTSDTSYVIGVLSGLFDCFVPAANVMVTSLENIGAIFHPAVVMFNAAAIERGAMFYFYNDITPQIASFIEQLDAERLQIGRAFGLNLIPAVDWISYAYPGIVGNDLCSKMRNNPAYSMIRAPTSARSRMLLEDVPTGILPLSELGTMAGVRTPLMQSVFEVCQALLGEDFRASGRTLKNLGLTDITDDELMRTLESEQEPRVGVLQA